MSMEKLLSKNTEQLQQMHERLSSIELDIHAQVCVILMGDMARDAKLLIFRLPIYTLISNKISHVF